MIYEMRTWTTIPGKMPSLVERYRRVLPIWQEVGVEVNGVWRTRIGRSNLFRVLRRFENLDDWEKKVTAFEKNPEVRKIVAEYGPVATYEDCEIMVPTDYSPLK